MKKNIIMMLVLSMVLMSVAAFASSNHEGGRSIWKKNCRDACHNGNTAGSPILSPDSKTQYQWKNSFSNDKVYIINFHKKGELPDLDDKEWNAIYDFVFHHSHDSNNPEDCMGNKGELVR